MNVQEAQRAEGIPDDEDANQEQDVAHAGDEEGLLRGLCRLGLVVPEADEKVRTQAHDLPEDQELEEVVRADRAEHAHGEQADLRVVAWLALLGVHVAEGVDEDEKAEEGDEDEHQRAQVVDEQGDVDVRGRKPCGGVEAGEPHVAVDRHGSEVAAEGACQEDLDEQDEGDDEGDEDAADRDVPAALRGPAADQTREEERDERCQ